MAVEQIALRVAGGLSAVLLRPEEADALVVFAHGAGADFRHASMEAIAVAFSGVGLATLRFNFPFMEAGRRRVDAQATSLATIADACACAAEAAPDLPLLAGGHSFGGRMTTHAAAHGIIGPVGLILTSFPLHPPGKPGVERAAHLGDVGVPMLFLSGTRDALARPDLLEGVVAGLDGEAELHWLDTADHGYRVLKRSRRTAGSVFDEMAAEAAGFAARVSA